MLKRALIFAGFLVLVIVTFFQIRELSLSFFVFFPMLILPAIFFLEEPYQKLFIPSLIVLAAVYLVQSIHAPFWESLYLGLACVVFIALFALYRFFWQRKILAETNLCEIALGDFETLKQKHQSRLESLHHLEKQVSGLLDLFEIARDFNDCLSFEAMADILFHRVMPELPFDNFLLTLFEKGIAESSRIFDISHRQGILTPQTLDSLSEDEQRALYQLRETRKIIQSERLLGFPLMADGEVSAALVVRGSQPEDLAKFEVLAAYLTLQVKKIRLYETVKELSIQDGLTGVFVRRHFMERLDEELKRSIKYKLPLALFMLDIDHFKRYNDEHGHLAGDATLKQVAHLLRESLRKVDIVARYGGEEFVVVIPETKDVIALEVAERIRSSIARHNFKIYSDQTRVTVSIGVALFPNDIPDHESKSPADIVNELIVKADQALYRAKEEGRNRIVQSKDL